MNIIQWQIVSSTGSGAVWANKRKMKGKDFPTRSMEIAPFMMYGRCFFLFFYFRLQWRVVVAGKTWKTCQNVFSCLTGDFLCDRNIQPVSCSINWHVSAVHLWSFNSISNFMFILRYLRRRKRARLCLPNGTFCALENYFVRVFI